MNQTNSPHAESRDLLLAIAEATGDAIFAKDRQGRLIFANPATLALIGKPLDAVLGRTDLEFLQDMDAARRVMANDARIMDSGVAEDLEETVPLLDGSHRIWFSRKLPYRDATGQVVGLLGVSRDITDRKNAEEGARRSRDELARVIASINDGLLVMDRQWRYTFVSERAAQLVGMRREDMIGQVVWELFPHAKGTRFHAFYHLAMETQQSQQFEEYYPEPLDLWLECRCFPGPDSLTVYFHDVSDRRQATEAAAEHKRKLDAALIAGEIGTFEWDISNQRMGGDENFRRMFGVPLDERGEAPLSDYTAVIHPQDRGRVDECIALTVETGADFEIEYRVIAGGRERWLLVRAKPERDAAGRVKRAAGVCLDISGRKQAEEGLRRSELRWNTAIEAFNEGAIIATEDEQVIYWNPAAQRLHGFTRADEGIEPLEETPNTFELWLPDRSHKLALDEWPMRRIKRGETVRDLELRLRRPGQGWERYVSYSGSLVETATGERLIFLSVHDLTEQHRAQEAAEAASKAKDHLLAVVSHELRTPLNPVLAITSYLQGKPDLPDDLREDIAMIRRNIEHEARIVDDLLSVTRLSRGKIVLHPEVIDLHALVRGVAAQFQAQMEAKALTLQLALKARVHHAWADPGRMQQVLANLLDNAIKFTPDDGEIAVRTIAMDDGRIRVEVADTGVGIGADVLPRLFVPFEQGETDTTRRHGGLGLGLVIAKGIMDLHGGTVAAYSQGPGKGATFALELASIAAPPERAVSTPPPSLETSGGCRILLVEDHADTLRMMQKLLAGLGYGVLTATSVADALQRVADNEFDVLISDIGLPDGSGLDVMQALRRHGDKHGIALSGYGNEEDIARSRDAGFAEHLVKPVDFETLDAAIRRLCD